jgi:hypothetical protein
MFLYATLKNKLPKDFSSRYHNECCINVAKICCATLRKSAAPDFTKNCCIKVTDYTMCLLFYELALKLHHFKAVRI